MIPTSGHRLHLPLLTSLCTLFVAACTPASPSPPTSPPDPTEEDNSISRSSELPHIIRTLPQGTGRQDLWLVGPAIQAAEESSGFTGCITTGRDHRVYLLLGSTRPGALKRPASLDLVASLRPAPPLQEDAVIRDTSRFRYAFLLTPDTPPVFITSALQECAGIRISPDDLAFQWD